MAPKNKLIDRDFSDFMESITDPDEKEPKSDKKTKISVTGKRARLIPVYKSTKNGNEMNLTSVFLSALVLVKEFREMFSKEIGLKRAGVLYAYTEVAFPKLKMYLQNKDKTKDRIDGLLLVVISGKIKDAVIFEMKSHAHTLNKDIGQIERYIELAQELGIDKMVTVSNQFVTSPKYSPVAVKVPSKFNLYHFSWHYINTMGKILWEDNDFNIVDVDQRNIMYEVTEFFDYGDSGVKNFDQTSNTWKDAIESFETGTVNPKDPYYSDAVLSWIQEERDIALKLSQLLGYVVDTQKRSFSSLQERIDEETQVFLGQNHLLKSEFKIKNAVSKLTVEANANNKVVKASVIVQNPEGKKVTSQLNFVKKQLEGKCASSSPDKYKAMRSKLTLDVIFKGRAQDISINFAAFESSEFEVINIAKEKKTEIKQIRVSYVMNYGNDFTNRKKFITKYEDQILNFYHVIVQNLKNGEVPTPQIKNPDIEE